MIEQGYIIKRNGEEKLRLPGAEIRSGEIWWQNLPILNGSKIPADKLAEAKANMAARKHNLLKDYMMLLSDNGQDGLEIINIRDEYARIAAESEARERRIKATIPGLDIIRLALSEIGREREEFERMMEDGDNDGACPPAPRKIKMEDIAGKYPIAEAYLKAEGWGYAAHDVKACAGNKAKKEIEASPENYKNIIATMEKTWGDYCTASID